MHIAQPNTPSHVNTNAQSQNNSQSQNKSQSSIHLSSLNQINNNKHSILLSVASIIYLKLYVSCIRYILM